MNEMVLHKEGSKSFSKKKESLWMILKGYSSSID